MTHPFPPLRSSDLPGADSDQEIPSSHLLVPGTPEICRVAKIALVVHANIGCELGHELVAQAQPQLGSRKAGAYAQFGNVLRGEVQFGCGLEDQLLRQTQIIFRFDPRGRSEEHTSELQSLMRISYAVFCLKKKKKKQR